MFIVRDSEIRQNDLSLSVRDYGSIQHYQIVCHDSGEFAIFSPGPCFATLLELISHYQEKNHSLPIHLTDPFPRKWPIVPSVISEDPWEASCKSFSFISCLYEGELYRVWKGKWKEFSMDVAIKGPISRKRSNKGVLKEVSIMQKLFHSKLVRLYAFCSDCPDYLIVTEPLGHGNLLDYLQERGRKSLELEKMIDISAQIGSGMAYLEKHRIIHCDLAARNVFVFGETKVKIGNFSHALSLTEKEFIVVPNCSVPIRWMPPEIKSGYRFSLKTDVWSFGIILYEIVTNGCTPYPGMSNTEVKAKTVSGYRMPQPDGCPKYLYNHMMSCWQANPEDRPTFAWLQQDLEDHLFIENSLQ